MCFALAMIVTWAIYPLMLRFAVRYGVVDRPAKRKLQDHSIPVFGGVTVILGMLIPMTISVFCMDWDMSVWLFAFILVMLGMGVSDDIHDLPVWVRLCLELTIVGLYIGMSGIMIDSLHGVWGIGQLPMWVSVPLSIIAGVGIINSINMIDGVDGYSSGFCIVASALFAVLFAHVGEYALCCFMVVCIGALVPFFLHNVFGVKSKMYIGDGGTLMLGAIMSSMVFFVLQADTPVKSLQPAGLNPIAFCLAVLCIPIFDTVRVMCRRILNGVSPFSPDKTHLHHLFLDLGFSHLGTACTLILTNTVIVAVWWGSYRLGAGTDLQLYVVLLMGVLTTFVFYPVVRRCMRHDNKVYRGLVCVGRKTQMEGSRGWQVMQRFVDRKALSNK